MKSFKVEIEDGLVDSIGIDTQGWVTFYTCEGDEITLEKDTLERGLACLASHQNNTADPEKTTGG